MGHENVGVIARAGRQFQRRHGLREGDRVFVEHYVGCFNCEWCRIGEYRHCEATDWRTNPDARRYGYTSAANRGPLWGGPANWRSSSSRRTASRWRSSPPTGSTLTRSTTPSTSR